jgi:NAD-dependent dihydropyrimidine dehydrogenase PreA subunit
MTRRIIPHMFGSLRGIRRSLREIADNPAHPKSTLSPEDLAEVEKLAHSLDVAAVSYAKLPREWIFRDKAVLYDNAMVMIMEMDKAKIERAPGPRAGEAVHETYHHLGDAANEVARLLRAQGYAAQAGHPLNGLALYPPLGQLAGLGWRGRHGMLISPQFGPRMRLAAVFTNVKNLPFFQGENEHRWIEAWCATCGACIKACPTGAIYETPVERGPGMVSCADAETCFPFFFEHHGCSVCIKVCPFNRQGYDAIRERALAGDATTPG